MSPARLKKFYKDVSVAADGDGFVVRLDGKTIKTAARSVLLLPNQHLAHAIAEEWRSQGDPIEPGGMPLTGLATATIDSVSLRRAEVIAHIVSFGRTDLVCYRAEEPPELVERQSREWDVLLAWLAETHSARLATGAGVSFLAQSAETLRRLEEFVSALSNWQLAALDKIVGLTGSLAIGLALLAGRLDADEAFAAAHIDELFQAEKWGVDPEAEARRNTLHDELRAAENFLKLV